LFDELNDEEKNIILWASLLHDIRKLGFPIFEGKDHVHPFKSAAAVLEVFNQLGILDVSQKWQKYNYHQVLRLLSESV
jgi:hypothetical protein